MGQWGGGLYDDDEACDVRDTVSLLSKMPGDGESILRIVLEQCDRDENLDEDGCAAFWLVMADQFVRRGITCDRVVQLALAAIDNGADLRDLEARGVDANGLSERQKLLSKLRERIVNAKPPRSRKVPRSPPKCAVAVGQIYSFPTMDGQGFNAWSSSWGEAKFNPNGWGSLVVLEVGRMFDWFPWGAYTPLVTDPRIEPDFNAAKASRTLFSDGVAFFAPKESHMKKMRMKLLGCIDVSRSAVDKLKSLSGKTPKRAVICDWSICTGALSRNDPSLGRVAVRDLQATI